MPLFNPTEDANRDIWAAQTAWVIDSVSGNNINSGLPSFALKTWGELQRRMKLTPNGHTVDGTTITLLNDLDSSDPMIIDWGCATNLVNVHVAGTPITIRSGSLTSVPTARTPASNLPNIITDSTVASWTADIGINSGRIIKMTSGPAANYYAWVTKNLGSNAARMSAFLDDNFTEQFPANGNTYSVLDFTFVQDYQIIPTSGFFYFRFLDLGDANSSMYSVQPNPATGGVQFNYSAVYVLNVSSVTVYGYDMALKTPPSLFEATVELFGGVVGDILGSPANNEVETAGELYCDMGSTFQGVRMNIINLGYVRYVDAMIFDSLDNGVVAGTGGVMRITKLSGSGNAGYGVSLTNTAEIYAVLSQCTITGTSGDVEFCGIPYTWTTLATNKGIISPKSNAAITDFNATEQGVFNTIGLVNVVSGIDMKIAALTTLYTVPTGRQFILDDVRLHPTSVVSITQDIQFNIGGDVTHSDWAAGYGLTGSVTNFETSMKDYISGQGVTTARKLYQSGDIIKFEVSTGAIGTTYLATLRVMGMLI